MASTSSPFDRVEVDALRRRRTVKWSLYGPDVLPAWVAEMDFDVAEPIRMALLEAIDREDFGYAPADVSDFLTACAEFLATAYGWLVPQSRIFLVADVLAGIAGALDVFVPTGAGVVMPTPVYPPFFETVELGGRHVVEVPLRDHGGRFELDVDAIDAALGAGARAVLLCNPHNPTGRALDVAVLAHLDEVVDHHGARVVADEVHARSHCSARATRCRTTCSSVSRCTARRLSSRTRVSAWTVGSRSTL